GEGVVGKGMTAAGAFEPSGRRWALSAIRPSVSAAPTTKKYFTISIIPPRAASAAASRFSRARGPQGSRAAVCRYHDGLLSGVKEEVRGDLSQHERGGSRWTQPSKMKTRQVVPLRDQATA